MCYSCPTAVQSWVEVLNACRQLLCSLLITAISIATSGIALALAVYHACI